MRPKKRSDEVAEDEELPFKLGELVLCRYSSYPYWPATVDQTHQKGSKGKFARWGKTSDGTRILTFWCTFSNEDTGGWVRADRMVVFHPKLVDKICVDEGHDFYEAQKTALETAEADFRTLHPDGDSMPVPSPPDDFDAGLDGDDDDLESVGEEDNVPDNGPEKARKRRSSKGRRKSVSGTAPSSKQASPKPAKDSPSSKRKSTPTSQLDKPRKRAKLDDRKRKRDEKEKEKEGGDDGNGEAVEEIQDEPAVSRRRKIVRTRNREKDDGDAERRIKELEEKLEDANQSIGTLKRRLRKRENQLASVTGKSDVVRVFAPPSPENLSVPQQLTSKTRSKPVSEDKFANMYKALEVCFTEFKKLVHGADDSRSSLERETKAVKEKFAKLINDVKSTEGKAAEQEKLLCKQLTDMLEGDVPVTALRTHKAGSLIKSMGKVCKGMPLINHLCTEIRSIWLRQVKDFMTEQAVNNENDAKTEKGASNRGNGDIVDDASVDPVTKVEGSKDGVGHSADKGDVRTKKRSEGTVGKEEGQGESAKQGTIGPSTVKDGAPPSLAKNSESKDGAKLDPKVGSESKTEGKVPRKTILPQSPERGESGAEARKGPNGRPTGKSPDQPQADAERSPDRKKGILTRESLDKEDSATAKGSPVSAKNDCDKNKDGDISDASKATGARKEEATHEVKPEISGTDKSSRRSPRPQSPDEGKTPMEVDTPALRSETHGHEQAERSVFSTRTRRRVNSEGSANNARGGEQSTASKGRKPP